MSWQKEFLLELMNPSSFDETQVQLLIGAIDFIAYDWMPDRGEMQPNLVSASGVRNRANDAEPIVGRGRFSDPPFNKKFRLCWCARRVNHLFQPDHRVLVFALTI